MIQEDNLIPIEPCSHCGNVATMIVNCDSEDWEHRLEIYCENPGCGVCVCNGWDSDKTELDDYSIEEKNDLIRRWNQRSEGISAAVEQAVSSARSEFAYILEFSENCTIEDLCLLRNGIKKIIWEKERERKQREDEEDRKKFLYMYYYDWTDEARNEFDKYMSEAGIPTLEVFLKHILDVRIFLYGPKCGLIKDLFL